MDYYSAIKKKILPFTTWMDVGDIMRSEMNDTEKDTLLYILPLM